MTVETERVGDRTLQVIQGDENFRSLFQWHRDLADRIYPLVAAVYHQESLDFPIDLRELNASSSETLTEVTS